MRHGRHTKAVSIRANLLHILRILPRATFARRVVFSRTTIFRLVVLRTRRKAWIELWPLNIIVWIRIDPIARLVRRILLQIPRTPARNLLRIHLLVKRQGKRSVGTEELGVLGVRVVFLGCEQAIGALAGRIGEVGWDVVEGDVLEGLQHYCHGHVVAVDQGDVVVGVSVAGVEGKFC